jgi:hypothetical protein
MITFESVTSPHPEAPELFRMMHGSIAWIGLTSGANSDHASVIMCCDGDCVQKLLAEQYDPKATIDRLIEERGLDGAAWKILENARECLRQIPIDSPMWLDMVEIFKRREEMQVDRRGTHSGGLRRCRGWGIYAMAQCSELGVHDFVAVSAKEEP